MPRRTNRRFLPPAFVEVVSHFERRPGCDAANAEAPGRLYGVELIQLARSFREMFGKCVFCGIIDRHPGLRIGWFEGGINWAVSTLQDATHIDASIKHTYNWPAGHDPEFYWRNNIAASFMIDPLGLVPIGPIGARRAMWSTDYPHNEGTLGYTRTSLRSVVDAVGVERAVEIVGGNVARFLGVRSRPHRLRTRSRCSAN